ncbi:hypothetical protein P3L10_030584 [Capsicum annuum]|uniref:uncharacterized protein LOC107856135 n=1 Tax=Capsicum annuum TaxID=4072 RepID=UPI001FB18432|nr:uncharacterized protein LOC107856135 [Capsicum annuum]
MRKNVDDRFSLNVSYTKMKRVKRIILDKLEGSFIDDFNKLEAYAQELRDNNFGSDMVIKISKDALEQEEYKDQLKSMGSVSEQAVKDLLWEKPIIKMLEDIRIKVMGRLKDFKEEGEKWTEKFFPYATELYNDFKIIEQGCQVQANGDLGYEVIEGTDRHVASFASKRCICRIWDLTVIPCPHAIKALEHDKQEPENEIHQWYSKQTYMLLYQHKIHPIKGEKFWKFHLSHAMEPPKIRKMVSRPKLKRERERNEAKKREGLWSRSRRRLKITCGHCSEKGHNQRICPLLQRIAEVLQDFVSSTQQIS